MKTGLFSKIMDTLGRGLRRSKVRIVISGLIGVLVFLILFGTESLSILDNRLFSRGDPGEHYIGWRFFRDSDWQILPGLMNRIDHPYSVSVIFTDSLPLMAVVFKLFKGILPREFNYLGLWTVFSFFMQGAAAAMILGLYAGDGADKDVSDGGESYGENSYAGGSDKGSGSNTGFSFTDLLVIIGAVFFVLTPAFVIRAFWHTTLTSHFLILFSLYLFFGRERLSERFSMLVRLLFWGILGFLCGSIHLYFLGICGLIACAYACDEWLRSDEGLFSFLAPLSFGISGLITIWLLGAFNSGMGSGAPGFGHYSFNLNSLFNGYGWSEIFNFPYYELDQIEGFAYLGFGMIALILLSGGMMLHRILSPLISRLRRQLPPEGEAYEMSSHWHLEFSCLPAAFGLFLISIMIAVSCNVTFGDRLLLSFDFSDAGIIRRVTDIFRSSGRFSWIAVYILMTGAMAGITGFVNELEKRKESLSAGIMTALIFTLLILQITDIYPGLSKRSTEVRETVEADSVLDDDYWDELAESGRYEHIVIMRKDDLTEDELYSLAFYAIDNGMTINNFNFARAMDLNIDEIASDSAAHPDDDKIYIFTELTQHETINYPELTYRIADGLLVGVKRE